MTVKLAVRPVDITSAGAACEFAFTEELEGHLSPEIKEAVQNGMQSSYLQGIFKFFKMTEKKQSKVMLLCNTQSPHNAGKCRS